MVISSSESSPKSPVRRFKPFEGVRVLGFFTLTAAFFLILLVFFFFFFFYLNNGSRRFGVGGNGVGGAYNGWGLGTVRSSFILGDGECDLFEGKWVWDERYPLYDSKDCAFLDEGFRCTENGRPDRFYEKWRWQPSHCNLPRFDAKKMLEKLRNRRVVFVGDSIGRNQWESLLCMLSSAVPDKKSIYEVNGSPITKHRGFLIFMFVDYNCTVEYYRSPFLVTQSRAPAGIPEKVKMTLKLDSIDWMSYKWRDADVLIFNSAHWWNYEKTIRSGCYFQVGDEVKMEMSVESAYYKAIGTLFDWINKEVNTSRTEVIFRTYAPVHFRGGDWKTGGNCHRETLPELVSSQISTKTWSHFLNPFSNMTLRKPPHAPLAALEVLNVTQLTAQRRDGHLSLYYLGPSSPAPIHKQDCSHWCLPGIPDTWNELLYAIFLRSQQQKSS